MLSNLAADQLNTPHKTFQAIVPLTKILDECYKILKM